MIYYVVVGLDNIICCYDIIIFYYYFCNFFDCNLCGCGWWFVVEVLLFWYEFKIIILDGGLFGLWVDEECS